MAFPLLLGCCKFSFHLRYTFCGAGLNNQVCHIIQHHVERVIQLHLLYHVHNKNVKPQLSSSFSQYFDLFSAEAELIQQLNRALHLQHVAQTITFSTKKIRNMVSGSHLCVKN